MDPAAQIVSSVRTGDAYAWTGHGNGTTAYVSNGLNQQISIGGSAANWDSKGNLTGEPQSAKTYGYSSENLLTSASGGVTIAYDPAMRLQQITAAATTKFAYDGLDTIAEYDDAGTMLARYVFGPGIDQPLERYDGSGTSNKVSLHADERGSIVALSYGSPFAPTINRFGEYGKPQSTNSGRFQYTGQKWIGEIGLYDYKARIYVPQLGIFSQTDPIGYQDSPNLYVYVLNDPVNLVDPLGLGCEGSACPPIVIEACQNGGVPPSCNSAQFAIYYTPIEQQRSVERGTDAGDDTQFKMCPVVMARITGIGPKQAAGDQRTAISHQRGRDIQPHAGGVAIDPRDWGVRSAGANASAFSRVVILPSWEFAQQPSNGAPAIPPGLPSTGSYHPIDAISPSNQAGLNLDLYRYSNQDQAFASTRMVPVQIFIPKDSKLQCPTGK